MSLLRLFLIFVIGWLVFRMVGVFLRIKQGPRDQATPNDAESHPGERPRPDDFPRGNIQDAEFEDLTPSPKSPSPPKNP